MRRQQLTLEGVARSSRAPRAVCRAGRLGDEVVPGPGVVEMLRSRAFLLCFATTHTMPAATKAEILLVGFGAVGVVYAYLLEQVRHVAPLL
jgi:hypothetical protein